MTMPKITSEAITVTDENGVKWEAVQIRIGEDFYIDIAVRDAAGAAEKAQAIAKDLQAALIDSAERAMEAAKKDRPRQGEDYFTRG